MFQKKRVDAIVDDLVNLWVDFKEARKLLFKISDKVDEAEKHIIEIRTRQKEVDKDLGIICNRVEDLKAANDS